MVSPPKVENPEINAIAIIPEGVITAQRCHSRLSRPWRSRLCQSLSTPATTAAADTVPAATPVLQIDAGNVAGKVSPDFFGLMTEEINFAYEGGIYGELIRNRSFKADAVVPSVQADTYVAGKYLPVSYRPDTKPRFWTTVGGASMVLDASNPLNEFLNVSLKLDASSASAASPPRHCQRRLLGHSRQAQDDLYRLVLREGRRRFHWPGDCQH